MQGMESEFQHGEFQHGMGHLPARVIQSGQAGKLWRSHAFGTDSHGEAILWNGPLGLRHRLVERNVNYF